MHQVPVLSSWKNRNFECSLVLSNLFKKIISHSKCFLKDLCVMSNNNEPAPGDGIRSLKTSRIFKAVNFELYVKPNAVIMGLGLVAIAGCTGYIAYMRSKYESLGYYPALKGDGTEQFTKKTSNWD